MFPSATAGAPHALADALAETVARLEPDAVPLVSAPLMWQAFDRIERLAGGAKLLLARRVDESGIWQRAGDRDAGVWLARHGGTSVTSARIALTTSKRLAKLPDTAAALRKGTLSVPQAEPVADAASRDQGAEHRLLSMAGEASLSELREECGRVKAAADPDPERTWERIRANRRLRHGTDSEGAWWLSGRGTTDDGGEVMAVLGPIVDEVFQQAHGEGRAEPREAYMWDALVELARRAHDWAYGTPDAGGTGTDDDGADGARFDPPSSGNPDATDNGGSGDDAGDADTPGNADGATERGDPGEGTTPTSSRDAMGDRGAADPRGAGLADDDSSRSLRKRVGSPRPGRRRRMNEKYLALLRADLTALTRGDVLDGEICEIAGFGPVPVERARELLGGAVLKLVLTKGQDVVNTVHLGRGPNAAQRVALRWLSPTCTVLGCNRTDVQYDHRIDWATTHHTVLAEMDGLCRHHHDLKTLRGWGLVEGHGKRTMVPPSDPRHPRHTGTRAKRRAEAA